MASARNVAIASAALYAGSAFVAPSSKSTASPSLRSAAAAAPAPGAESKGFGAVQTAAAAACFAATAATVSKGSKSRRQARGGGWNGERTETYGVDVEEAVDSGQIPSRGGQYLKPVVYGPTSNPIFYLEPLLPKPGSQKMWEAMIGADVDFNEGQPWDPLGFSKLYDRNFDMNNHMTYPHVQWLREAEIKHGRLAMIGFVGAVVQQYAQIPGLPVEPDWTKAWDACLQNPIGILGLGQISIFAFIIEGKYASNMAWIGQMDREPGDLGFDPLKLCKRADFDLKGKQLSEIKNGRLAMIGFASLLANHFIPGSVPLLTGAY